MTISTLLAATALVVASPQAQQPKPAAAPEATQTLRSLSPSDIAPAATLPAPAAPGTPEHGAEVAEVVAVQAAASADRKAQAIWDDRHEGPAMFVPTLGPSFDLARMPATKELLGIVQNDAEIVAGAAKVHFVRQRPWVFDQRIESCEVGGRSRTPVRSYPSGHSTIGYAMAVALAHLRPDLAPKLLSRAQDFAYSRIVCGVHYRSDTTAGQVVGTMVANEVLADPRLASIKARAVTEMKTLPSR